MAADASEAEQAVFAEAAWALTTPEERERLRAFADRALQSASAREAERDRMAAIYEMLPLDPIDQNPR